MANWGQRKYVLGEVDVFKVEPDYELYGHMNINYLKLDRLPRFDDGWQPVLDALRSGRFFVSTGEVLLPEFKVGGKESGQTLRLSEPRDSRGRGPGRVDLPAGFCRGDLGQWRSRPPAAAGPQRGRSLRD